MNKQVDKNSYQFKRYCDLDRWFSYWHQLNEILELNPKNILEIGVGDRVLASYFKNNTEIKYSCLDIAKDLNPDFVGSVDDMAFINNDSFDLVCAFEVLEHLPFEKFAKSLKELRRIAKKHVVISLPHWGRHFGVNIRLPYFKKLNFSYKFDLLPQEHKFNGQHYWEIGKRGYSAARIKNSVKESGFKILRDYVAHDSPYHHFFVLEKLKPEL